MLLKKDLLEAAEPQYRDMLKQVDVANFIKCVAAFAGLKIKDVCDDVIKRYLLTWAKNKYRFFKMFGDKIKVDISVEYSNEDNDKSDMFLALGKQYLPYALWLDEFKYCSKNKITGRRDFSYSFLDLVDSLFGDIALEGTTITHFFKRYLNAPDELVTAIGRIYENDKVKGIYTLSIDPVDMMLASENPYNWQSCYRLSVPNEASHADGCMAAILDDSELIAYIWDTEGNLVLSPENGHGCDKCELRDVRYKKMRNWISISPSMNSIYFNSIYPGKSRYDQKMLKQFREIAEGIIANFLGESNQWKRIPTWQARPKRELPYGYDEFSSDNVYTLSSKEEEADSWAVYNENIECPCGCGCILPGSDYRDFYGVNEDEGEGYWTYNGDGFIYDNFTWTQMYWCEYAEEYCQSEPGKCCEGNCWYWDDAHPVCEFDEDHHCNDPRPGYSVCDGVIEANEDTCAGCPLYALHHQKENEED